MSSQRKLLGLPVVERVSCFERTSCSPVAVAILTLVCILLTAPVARAADEFVDFTGYAGFEGPSLTDGSLTVTGSDDLFITANGIGIVGGGPVAPFGDLGSQLINEGETVNFDFSQPASNIRVVYLLECAVVDRGDGGVQGDGINEVKAILKAYDNFNNLLKEVAISTTSCKIDFSSELGVAPVSRVEMTVVEDGLSIPTLAFETGAVAIPEYACEGFQPPFHRKLMLKQRNRRAIPVKLVLRKANGDPVTDDDVASAPLIDVSPNPNPPASSKGKANSADEFRYDPDDEQWIYNLDTRGFDESGYYTVSVTTGDDEEYTIDTSDSCTQQFQRLP